jgi:hypothetical protein
MFIQLNKSTLKNSKLQFKFFTENLVGRLYVRRPEFDRRSFDRNTTVRLTENHFTERSFGRKKGHLTERKVAESRESEVSLDQKVI